MPSNPRTGFASYQALYKVYVITKGDVADASSPGIAAKDEEFAGLILSVMI